MKLGIAVPVVNNWSGFAQSLSTWYSAKHQLRYYVIDNSVNRRSVPESWNLGCRALFATGVEAVIGAYDDVLCHEETIDRLVAFWKERQPMVATAANVRDTGITPSVFLTSAIVPPYEERNYNPDMSFFLLPRKTWEEVGAFDENFFPAYFEDNDYFTRIALAGGEMLLTTSAPMYHIGGGTQFNPPPDIRQKRDRMVSGAAFQENKEFYTTKWGCTPSWDPGVLRETAHKHPYNDPKLSISDVPLIRQPNTE